LVRGNRGRGAGGNTIVFGLLKRGGQGYTELVPHCQKKTLQAVTRGKIDVATLIHTDGWRGYDGRVAAGYNRPFRGRHGPDELVPGASHIHGIESFWHFAKARRQPFHGLAKDTFELPRKECAFRFNTRHEALYKLLPKWLRHQPL
jgi:transposase